MQDLNQPATVSLTLLQWNGVLSGIAELPWKLAEQLMVEVRRQLVGQMQEQAIQRQGEQRNPAEQPTQQAQAHNSVFGQPMQGARYGQTHSQNAEGTSD